MGLMRDRKSTKIKKRQVACPALGVVYQYAGNRSSIGYLLCGDCVMERHLSKAAGGHFTNAAGIRRLHLPLAICITTRWA